MPNHYKISPTAWLVAEFRSYYTDIRHAKEVSNAISKKSGNSAMRFIFFLLKFFFRFKPEKMMSAALVESRYLCMEDLLPKDGDFVLVELACGLSPRGLTHARKGRTVIETDLEGVLEMKREILDEVYGKEGRPQHHHLMSVDVLHADQMQKLGEFCLKEAQGKPIYILHEGMTPYFTIDELESFRNHMSDFLRKYAPQGFWVTPDFSPLPKELQGGSRPATLLLKLVSKFTKRDVKSFDTLKEAADFLAHGSLHLEAAPNDHIVKNLSIIKRSRLDPEAGAAILGGYKSCVIRLR